MNKTLKTAIIITTLASHIGFNSSAAPTTETNSLPNEPAAQRDARMAWWRDAKFGMFIHWGVYSVPAGVYLIIFNWPKDGNFQLPAVKTKVLKGTLLAALDKIITISQDDSGVALKLPTEAPDAVASVVRLDLADKILQVK